LPEFRRNAPGDLLPHFLCDIKFFMSDQQQPESRIRLYTFAVTECLLVFPAAFFLTVATLRGSQPREYEPARTSWFIFEWMSRHFSRLDAAVVFLAFPTVALTLGIATLLQSWRQDELFRWDAIAFAAVLRRNWHFLIVSVGAIAGAVILTAALVHMITD
jgi:hypothetical protein